MTMHISKQDAVFGSFTELDVEALGIGDMKLSIGYSHADRLEFTVTAANHTLPLAFDDFIKVWDDEGDVDTSSEPQSSSNPLFEGWIEDVQPGSDTNTVKIVAYDPTYRSVRTAPLMNDGWNLDSSDHPTPIASSYPRVVFNVTQDNDDDYAYSIGQNYTLGQIIQTVLNDGRLPLYHVNAGPGNGTASGPYNPFVVADLGEDTSGSSEWVGGLDFEPQEKIVSHSESIRSFIDRLLGQYDPTTKVKFIPGERLWRFFRVKTSPIATITINDPSAWHGMVNSIEMQRSMEGRHGAVQFYGPEGLEWRTAEWADDTDDTLEPINQVTIGSIPNTGLSFNEFQITDPDFTRIANRGPYAIYVPGPTALWNNANGSVMTELSAGVLVQTWSPSLQYRFANSGGGGSGWKTVSGLRWDARTGRIWIGDGSLYRLDPTNPTNKFEEPIGIRFVYPALVEPLTVREPETGFEGTAYTVAGLRSERKEYDESLAVGYAYGIPITTVTRVGKFRKLARQILNAAKDIVYTGGITLEGINYEFARLNRRVNLAAKNDDGSTLTTGWESIGAIVTDVEYDFTEQTTTLQFSSDQMETIGMDPEKLKDRLKIRPAQQYFFMTSSVQFSYRRSFSFSSGFGIGQDTTVSVNRWTEWLDEFGEVQ